MQKTRHNLGMRTVHEYSDGKVSALVVHDPDITVTECKGVITDIGLPGKSYSFFLACNGQVYYFDPQTSTFVDTNCTVNQVAGVIDYAKEVALVSTLKGETISV